MLEEPGKDPYIRYTGLGATRSIATAAVFMPSAHSQESGRRWRWKKVRALQLAEQGPSNRLSSSTGAVSIRFRSDKVNFEEVKADED